jgi:hypothetical protein
MVVAEVMATVTTVVAEVMWRVVVAAVVATVSAPMRMAAMFALLTSGRGNALRTRHT